MTHLPIQDTVANTRTGRYIQNIELPPELQDLFPSPSTPPRCIASKSAPDEYSVITLGVYPLDYAKIPTLEIYTVHANALIHTTVMP